MYVLWTESVVRLEVPSYNVRGHKIRVVGAYTPKAPPLDPRFVRADIMHTKQLLR